VGRGMRAQDGSQAGARSGHCAGCAAPLASDNATRLCGGCHREQRDQLRTPPAQLRDDFFETDQFRAAFGSQDIGRVLTAYRHHPRYLHLHGRPISQELLGRWLGLNQGQVSKLENAKPRPEENLGTLRHIARTLHLPARLLWFSLTERGSGGPMGRDEDSAGTASQSGDRDGLLVAHTGMDTLELVRRVRASAISAATVDALNITVEQLCCDYSHGDADQLITAGKRWLGNMTDLLGERLTLVQHRQILHNAGMLALLVGCLEYDLGDARSAEATRRMALELGKESGDPGIIGWAHEMLAWFHLTTGNYRAVIPAAESGTVAAPSHSVSVQLYGQQAKAYARLGLREEVHSALERGRELLDRLPYPENPANHFVVDPDKWDFYAMDTYRIVGQDDLAERNAEEVIRRSRNPDGSLNAPMRDAEAQLTLAVVAARQGDTGEAGAIGLRALRNERQSRPSLLMVATELAAELDTHGARSGTEFREVLHDIRRSAGARPSRADNSATPRSAR
jgi:tetratricopeptide (TPR) repeat protein/transcriptional regulator with XRE-family HTH domain